MTQPADKIAEIRERLEAATPGPWEFSASMGFAHIVYGQPVPEAEGRRLRIAEVLRHGPGTLEDGHLIANAPADIDWLLRVAEAAMEMYDEDSPGALTSLGNALNQQNNQ